MVLTGPVIRRRLAVLAAVFFGLYIVLGIRLVVLQVVQAESLQKRAQAQWTSESVIAPARGSILDRNGTVMAISATAYIASVSPRQVKDAAQFARILAPVLNMDEATILKRASDTSKGGVTLKRQLDRDQAQQIKAMIAEAKAQKSGALDGLYLEEDSKRYYPMGEFATQLIGLTTIDGVGQSGLESSLNAYLSGKSGLVLEEIDGKGREIAYGASEYVAAVDGGNVTLTIDASIQAFAEKAARECLSANKAKGVRVLVMNPDTGEILAMVSKPSFDLNDPPRNDVAVLTEQMRNRTIADAYEPGSTFKIITSSIALDLEVTNVNEGFYCSGSTTVDGSRIKCWGKPHGAESMAKALQNSCNPVFVELGLRIGTDRFYEYMDAFGLGKVTGVDIPGEGTGILIAKNAVKRVDMARIGFGQSVAVTPLQLLTAACAAINGGNLMKPYVVKEIADVNGQEIVKGRAQVVSHPISAETSKTMRRLLEDVVSYGGGRNAYIEGYRVGGKTGTAQVYVDGVVSSDTHIGSFIGFAPMDDPQIAVMVIVDEADVPIDFGSTTAAPYAKKILQDSLMYMGIAPSIEEDEIPDVEVPDVTGMNYEDAQNALAFLGLQCVTNGSGGEIIGQLPAAGAKMKAQSLVMLYMKDAAIIDEYVTVPDVTGMTVVEANRLIASYGLSMVVSGSGFAVYQEPKAGTQVTPTTSITVVFGVQETEENP